VILQDYPLLMISEKDIKRMGRRNSNK